jgi:hypothetical protein
MPYVRVGPGAAMQETPSVRTAIYAALAVIVAILPIGATAPVAALEIAITPAGQALARELDKMGVESKWPAGVHVDWETGIPDGKPVNDQGRHTHCSAFVASTAKHLGIYILRPPEHSAKLLANAQSEWLSSDGAAEGWHLLGSAAEAQDAANHGELVVASYRSHRDDKPGHIAIVRPSQKDQRALATEGPDVIQAGSVNKSRISVREGFSGHPAAWNEDEIDYYAHALRLQ